MKLLYRGQKRDDEFLPDYVQRMSDKNGFSSVKIFKRELIKYFKTEVDTSHDLRYQAVSRVSLEMILNRNIPIDQYQRFYNRKRGWWHGDLRVCSSCWAIAQYVRFYWWLRSYEECHTHNEELVFVNVELEVVNCEDAWSNFSKITYLIVNTYGGSEFCQSLVINELDRSKYDLNIIEGIEKYFGFDRKVISAVGKLKNQWASGFFVGQPAEKRVCAFSMVLAKHVGDKDFWRRVIVLSVMANKRGLYLGLPISMVENEYSLVCRYILYSDSLFYMFLKKVEGFKKYSELVDVSAKEFLCEEIEIPNDVVIKIKSSLFWCKGAGRVFLDGYSRGYSVFEMLPKRRNLHGNREF